MPEPWNDLENYQPSYPTKSLDFLKQLKPTINGHDSPLQTNGAEEPYKPLQLRIIVVGAGIGGLSAAVALSLAGHTVTVLEQAPALAEIGAGIQIPPNSSRILLDWGLGPSLRRHAVEPESMTFRRWKDGAPIARTVLDSKFREQFRAPYFVIHRAHFHQALHERAVELGVKIELNAKVEEYDVERPSVTLVGGEVMDAELVIAADGIKSTARKAIDNDSQPSYLTGFAAYRATVDVELMQQNPDIAWLLEKPNLHLWVGPDRHAMTYTIAGGKQFNLVLAHKETRDPSTWPSDGMLASMQAEYADWDPTLTKILSLVKNVQQKWPLMASSRQDSWVSKNGKLVMIGDAAHAMLPFMSQGAAMAVEDAVALATTLSSTYTTSALVERLRIFSRVRAKRSYQMQEASFINGKLWHFHDGPEQEARDAAARAEVVGLPFEKSSNQWSDPTTNAWAYGYDAVVEMQNALSKEKP